MKLKPYELSVRNTFKLDLIDAESMCLKNTVFAYNIVLDSFWNAVYRASISGISLGTGTGTLSPTRTSLFNQHTTITVSFTRSNITYLENMIKVDLTATVGTLVVATFTEIGINMSNLVTHAFLEDAEGNPISIQKTNTEILIVNATFYLSFTPSENLITFPSGQNPLLTNALRSLGMAAGGYPGGLFLNFNGVRRRMVRGYGHRDHPTNIHNIIRLNDLNNQRFAHTTAIVRTQPDQRNFGYANYIAIGLFIGTSGGYGSWALGCVGAIIPLPNFDIFPAYRLKNMQVGFGDGVTVSYDCPLPFFMKDTEQIRVDSQLLTRGIDYTIDHKGNSKRDITYAVSNYAVANIRGNGPLMPSNVFGLGFRTFTTGPVVSTGAQSDGPNSALFLQDFEAGDTYSATGSEPLVFEFDEPVECNGCWMPRLLSSSGNITLTNLCLEYSQDEGKTWEVAVRFPTPLTFGTAAAGFEVPGGPLFSFESTIARLWRFSKTNGSTQFVRGIAAHNGIHFGYYGQGIIFTNPPAENASIVFNAMVDRPWKDENYLIDMNGGEVWFRNQPTT